MPRTPLCSFTSRSWHPLSADPQQAKQAEAEAAYLRNLLVVTAEQSGFAGRTTGAEVAVNVERIGVAGLALLDNDGRVLVATQNMPPLQARLLDFVRGLAKGERTVLDIHIGIGGQPTMGFVVPVYSVQSTGSAADQVGVVLGIKEVADELYPLLKQPGASERSAEAALVRPSGATVEYLSPLREGPPPLKLKLALDTPDLDSAFALRTPGGFGLKRDYRNEPVLVTGRAVPTANWALLYKVDRAEALGGSDTRLARLAITFGLVIAFVASALIATWRWGTSRRAARATAHYRATAERLDQQQRFLQLLTDSQPNPIFILDDGGHYRFANAAAAGVAGIPASDMVGKTVESVLGPHYARRYAPLTKTAIEKNESVRDTHRISGPGGPRVFQSVHIPLSDGTGQGRRVLVVEEDVTEAVLERERRERTLKQVVQIMVALVDCRDPHAAEHSNRLAAVSSAIATTMNLETQEVDVIETAARLVNMGKILVRRDVLTKPQELTEAEKAMIRDAIDQTPALLSGIEFDGPVLDIIRQAHERWDGSGRPRGLAGEDILLGARIIAVANAFIAMTSGRAHRQRQEVGAALDTLTQEAGRTFDRGVVAALVHFMENTLGRPQWNEFVGQMEA